MRVPIERFLLKVFSLRSRDLFLLGETPLRFRLYLFLCEAAFIKRAPGRNAFKAALKEKCQEIVC